MFFISNTAFSFTPYVTPFCLIYFVPVIHGFPGIWLIVRGNPGKLRNKKGPAKGTPDAPCRTFFTSDSEIIYIIRCDGGCVKALLIHEDGFFCNSLTVLHFLDHIVNINSLEGVTLPVIVPVLIQQLL